MPSRALEPKLHTTSSSAERARMCRAREREKLRDPTFASHYPEPGSPSPPARGAVRAEASVRIGNLRSGARHGVGGQPFKEACSVALSDAWSFFTPRGVYSYKI